MSLRDKISRAKSDNWIMDGISDKERQKIHDQARNDAEKGGLIMRENSKFIHDKFREMFPLLYEEVGYWAEDKNDKQAINLYSAMVNGRGRLLYKFKYISDSKWSIERV